ncbi:MAG: POTRA domain-containing protein, partial [Vicinamibacterales bacterium]
MPRGHASIRRRAAAAALALAALLAWAAPARADVTDYLGRPIAAVRVEVDGEPVTTRSVIELIETRAGDPLSMQRVRESLDHLVGLGRFEDVRIFAEEAPGAPGAVVVRWELTPVRHVARIDVTGRPEVGASELRRVLDDGYGQGPAASRVPAMADTLRTFYADRGYRGAVVRTTLEPGDAPDAVRLVLDIDAGPRTRLSAVEIRGGAPAAPAEARLRIAPGDAYDRATIDARVAAYEDELRGEGYYEASVEPAVDFSPDGTSAVLTVTVDPGPRVRVVFAGDPLPADRRDALVPIRAERSVDEDLLEDASRNIERDLREEGYRSASAPYTREESGDEMVLTFTVTRGPLYRLEHVAVEGQSQLGLDDVKGLLRLQPGEPFVDARVAAVAAAITELYRVRGFTAASVNARVAVLPEASAQGAPYRPVAVTFEVTEGQPSAVGAVTLEGVSAGREAAVRALLALTPGRPFYRPALGADQESVERYYRNDGFQQVSVRSGTAEAGAGVIDVHWTVSEGPQTRVGHVLVAGNDRTSADLIRREIVLRPGEPLGEDALVESQRRLSALGLFRRVRISELPHGASSDRDVLVSVEEAPTTTISYGGGLEVGRRVRPAEQGGQAEERVEVAPRAFFEIGRRNLWGKNRSVNLFTRVSLRPRDPGVASTDPTDTGGYGLNEYRVVGTFREPRAFGTTGDAQATAFVEQAIRPSFNFRRRGVRGEYARRFGSGITASGRYALDRTVLFDAQIQPADQLLIDRLFPQVRLSTFTGSVLRDSRNDVLDPERGAVFSVDSSWRPAPSAPRSASSRPSRSSRSIGACPAAAGS